MLTLSNSTVGRHDLSPVGQILNFRVLKQSRHKFISVMEEVRYFRSEFFKEILESFFKTRMNFVRHEVNRYIKLMNTSALSLVSNFPVFSNALWDNWYQEQAKNPIQILIHQNAFDIKTKFCL